MSIWKSFNDDCRRSKQTTSATKLINDNKIINNAKEIVATFFTDFTALRQKPFVIPKGFDNFHSIKGDQHTEIQFKECEVTKALQDITRTNHQVMMEYIQLC